MFQNDQCQFEEHTLPSDISRLKNFFSFCSARFRKCRPFQLTRGRREKIAPARLFTFHYVTTVVCGHLQLFQGYEIHTGTRLELQRGSINTYARCYCRENRFRRGTIIAFRALIDNTNYRFDEIGSSVMTYFIVSLIGCYLLVSKAHLPSCVSRNVHPAEEESGLIRGVAGARRVHRPPQLTLNSLVVLLVYDVVNAVPVDQKILLKNQQEVHCSRNPSGA